MKLDKHRKLRENASQMRELLKRIPGAVLTVMLARQLRSQIVSATCKLYLSRLKSMYWRSHHFDALEAPYAISNHKDENYIVHTTDKVIGKLLYARGFFDFQKFERAMRIIEAERGADKSRVLYDIGANIGPICIPALTRGYVKRAIAFEPDPQNFRLLRINTILNDVENLIECHEIALGAEKGVAQLVRNEDNHGDHRIVAKQGFSAEIGAVVVRRLDDFLPDGDIEGIIWIDVQGFEAAVITGAQKAINNRWPIVLEFFPNDLKTNNTLEQLIDLLVKSDYSKMYDLDDGTLGSVQVSRDNIDKLSEVHKESNTFTDILLL